MCRVKYCNSLPDIPFDPKFITYPFDQHRCTGDGKHSQNNHRVYFYFRILDRFRHERFAVSDVMRSFVCRFVQYKATSLEKQHKHDLLTEPDLGVTIDLINPDTYRIDPNSECALTARA